MFLLFLAILRCVILTDLFVFPLVESGLVVLRPDNFNIVFLLIIPNNLYLRMLRSTEDL